MMTSNTHNKEDIKLEIERLQKELKKSDWPKTTVIHCHRDKESNYDMGEELGLEGDALDNFRYVGYEVSITIVVDVDGNAYATHFNDVLLPKRVNV